MQKKIAQDNRTDNNMQDKELKSYLAIIDFELLVIILLLLFKF